MRTPEELAAEARQLLDEQGKVDPAERFAAMVQTGLIDSEGRPRTESQRRRQRVPNLAKLAEHTDPEIAAGARELIAMARVLKTLAAVPPDRRANIVRAAAALYGVRL